MQLDLGTDTVQRLGRYLLLEPGGHTLDLPAYRYWIVRNAKSGAALGLIEWYPRWKQYVLCPNAVTVFNHSCLRDIAGFLTQQNGQQD